MALFRAKYYKKRIKYYGTATPLQSRTYNLAATTVGNYALFGGGEYNSNYSRIVYAYDTSLTQSMPDGLTANVTEQGWCNLAATTVGNYALFGSGDTNYSTKDTVVSYNFSLTRSFPTVLSQARTQLAATTVDNYALFGGGGYLASYLNSSNVVDAYNTSLTRTIPVELSQSRYNLAATTVGNYALFGGGTNRNDSSSLIDSDVVDVYNNSLTRSTISPLSQRRRSMGATTIGDYALFGGGSNYNTSVFYSIVDTYDNSLVKNTISPLSQARCLLAATTVDNYALFGGGYNTDISSGSTLNTMDVYDVGLTRSTSTPLSYTRRSLASTTVGNYALFGGGIGENSQAGYAVDVYTV